MGGGGVRQKLGGGVLCPLQRTGKNRTDEAAFSLTQVAAMLAIMWSDAMLEERGKDREKE